MLGHELQDTITLALARAIADRLRGAPGLLNIGLQNLARWSVRNADAPGLLRCYSQWRTVIEKGLGHTLGVLELPGDDGQRLRQSNPFTGILTPREVWAIKRRCRDDATAA